MFNSMSIFAILFLTLTENCSGTFQSISFLKFIREFWEQKFFDFKTPKQNLKIKILKQKLFLNFVLNFINWFILK